MWIVFMLWLGELLWFHARSWRDVAVRDATTGVEDGWRCDVVKVCDCGEGFSFRAKEADGLNVLRREL